MNFTDYFLDNAPNVGGNIYDSPVPHKVIDFSGNSNILKTPKYVMNHIKRCDAALRPDVLYKKAVLNLSGKHGITPECIIIGNSTYSLLNTTLKSLRLRSAYVVMPCETEYKHICRINHCSITPYILQERKNFKLDCDDFMEKLTAKYDAVIISNPCDITGRVVSKQDMNTILDYCQSKGIYVIIDETYMDFALTDNSCVDMLNKYHNMIVIRSVKEYYNLAGINAAYAAASSEVTEIIKENILPWQTDVYGCALCESAYHSEKFDLKTKKWIFEEKNYLIKKLRDVKQIRIIHSDCHYMLMSLGEVSATTVYNRLLKSNILIRDASGFTGLDGSYIRVAVRDKKSNDKFTDELMRCLI